MTDDSASEPAFKKMPRSKVFEHVLSEADEETFEKIMALKMGGQIGLIMERSSDSDKYRADNSSKPMKRFTISVFEMS